MDFGEDDLINKADSQKVQHDGSVLADNVDEFSVGHVMHRIITSSSTRKVNWNELRLKSLLVEARVKPTKYFGDVLTGTAHPVSSPANLSSESGGRSARSMGSPDFR